MCDTLKMVQNPYPKLVSWLTFKGRDTVPSNILDQQLSARQLFPCWESVEWDLQGLSNIARSWEEAPCWASQWCRPSSTRNFWYSLMMHVVELLPFSHSLLELSSRVTSVPMDLSKEITLYRITARHRFTRKRRFAHPATAFALPVKQTESSMLVL